MPSEIEWGMLMKPFYLGGYEYKGKFFENHWEIAHDHNKKGYYSNAGTYNKLTDAHEKMCYLHWIWVINEVHGNGHKNSDDTDIKVFEFRSIREPYYDKGETHLVQINSECEEGVHYRKESK